MPNPFDGYPCVNAGVHLPKTGHTELDCPVHDIDDD